jgi:hypothetical protein
VLAAAAVAALALSLSAGQASANWSFYQPSSDTTVSNVNSGTVFNTVSVKASTGDNSANGGHGGSSFNWYSNNTPKGGSVTTGAVSASTLVTNQVNYNESTVKADCGCSGDITVGNVNSGVVYNTTYVKANSGDNSAKGGGSSHFSWWGGSNAGGEGGTIKTGTADSYGEVANIVNTNVTRITRGGSSN